MILTVCHGGDFLRSALASLYRVDFPVRSWEIIVTGRAEDIESKNIVNQTYSTHSIDVRYIGCHNPTRARLLNTAVRNSCGRILAFADDDCVFRKDWLRLLQAGFEKNPHAGILGGQDELENTASPFDRALDETLNSFAGTGGIRRGSGPRVGEYYPKLWNMAVTREAIEKIAFQGKDGCPFYFKESLKIHEDVDLAHRIKKDGKEIVLSPHIIVGHHRDTTYSSFIQRNFMMGQTCRSLGLHRLPHILLSSLVLLLLPWILAVIFFPSLRTFLLFIPGVYALILLGTAMKTLIKTKSPKASLLVPVMIFSLHLSRGLGYIFPHLNLRLLEDEEQ